MSEFEKTTAPINGRTVTITSWIDSETGTWKASAPGFILHHGRADEKGQPSRQAAVAMIMREMETVLHRTGIIRKPL